MEMRYSINACSCMLNFQFCENLSFGVKNTFFIISESKICKKSEILPGGYSIGQKVAYKISGQYVHK